MQYVSVNAAQLTREDKEKTKHALLWGDAVEVIEEVTDTTVRGRAHGAIGLVEKKNLGAANPRLLEIYVIDVGQGDAILIRTPDQKWHLVDGGPPASKCLMRKSARRFLAWKFGHELGRDAVALETVFLSHSDEDHFGGLTEILASCFAPKADERPLHTTAERFLHAGVAKYEDMGLGVVGDRIPSANLLGGRETFTAPPATLAEKFGEFAVALASLKNAAGEAPSVRRITRGDAVEGYEPGSEVEMRVLGPVPENPAGDLRSFGKTSLTVNGHSIVLRLDFKDARILLTGDINAKSQRHLLGHVDPAEFEVDVVKACHHGADDIDFAFTRATASRATVVSSGDAENYSHPRPIAVGAYAYYGRRSCSAKGEAQPPMIYSTEVARSLKTRELSPDGQPPVTAIKEVVFGLVNIRTDGKKIVCATRNEINHEFDVEVFRAGGESPPDDRPVR